MVQRVPNLWGWQPCDKPGLLWINVVVFNHDGAIGLESRSLAWRRPGGKIPKQRERFADQALDVSMHANLGSER